MHCRIRVKRKLTRSLPLQAGWRWSLTLTSVVLLMNIGKGKQRNSWTKDDDRRPTRYEVKWRSESSRSLCPNWTCFTTFFRHINGNFNKRIKNWTGQECSSTFSLFWKDKLGHRHCLRSRKKTSFPAFFQNFNKVFELFFPALPPSGISHWSTIVSNLRASCNH